MQNRGRGTPCPYDRLVCFHNFELNDPEESGKMLYFSPDRRYNPDGMSCCPGGLSVTIPGDMHQKL